MSDLNCTTAAKPLSLAYRLGDAARDEGRISASAHQLYESCLRLTNGNSYVYAGFEWLAGQLHRSSKTIQRWMRELIAAGLVWRERRLNRSWLTHITALEPEPAQDSFFASADVHLDGTAMSTPPINQSMDGADTSASAANPEAVAVLREAGLVIDEVIAEIATAAPIDWITQAVAYVRRVRRAPGLIAYLWRKQLPIPGIPVQPAPAPAPVKRTAADYMAHLARLQAQYEACHG